MLTVADMSRSRDDYARYYFAHNFVHRPIFGVHGSFLLTSGKVENAVCWDTDSLVEDYWFGLQVRNIPWTHNSMDGWIPTDYPMSRHGVKDITLAGFLVLCVSNRRKPLQTISNSATAGFPACGSWTVSLVNWPAYNGALPASRYQLLRCVSGDSKFRSQPTQ